MSNQVLIFSDNAFLSKKIFEIIKKKKIPNCDFSFSISPLSNKEDFKFSNKIDIKVFNLKNQNDIDIIKKKYDLIFSVHCKQIFPINLVNQIKCINIHPGYNPINRGWYPQVFSIINKLPIGATIHEMDEKLDHGSIIVRALVTKDNFDTSESLYNKILDKEIELMDKYIVDILKNNYVATKPEGEGNLYLKEDFNRLLKLDLEEQISIGNFIDRLRALTHGDFDNVYFIDPETGKKIFVKIWLKPENNE